MTVIEGLKENRASKLDLIKRNSVRSRDLTSELSQLADNDRRYAVEIEEINDAIARLESFSASHVHILGDAGAATVTHVTSN